MLKLHTTFARSLAPRRPNPLLRNTIIALLALFCAASAAQAQETSASSDVYEGRPIRDVLVLRSARGDETERQPLTGDPLQRAINNIRAAAGAPFRRAVVDEDVNRLTRLNAYSVVDAFAELQADGTVKLIYVLNPQLLIEDVQVTGNRELTDQQIAGEVDILRGAPIDRFQIDRSARRIEDLYREKGYYNVEVTVDEDELAGNGIVLFQIREGLRVKVSDIRFEGAVSFRSGKLFREVDTHRAGVFRRGAIDDLQLNADVSSLITFYRDRGYLDVRVDYQLRPSPDGKEAILFFIVDEGPLYTFRDLILEFPGANREGFDPVFSREQILGLMVLKRGSVYGVRDIRQSVESIDLAYGQLGYTDARISRFEQRDPERPLVDMVLQIDPGPQYLTGEVLIAGNELTKSKVVRRAVELQTDRPLSELNLRRTERNLEFTRLFNRGRSTITFQRPDPVDPRYRDVLIEVEETNTGSLDIGGAVNSDAGVIGRIALNQRNFDIADTPDSWGELFTGRAFRGAGQTFQIEAAPGDRIESYSISLGEPSLLDTDYSGSAAAYYRSRDFDEFDERRYGGRFAVGRRFGTRWNGNINLRLESVEIEQISPFRPTEIVELDGEHNVIIGIGPSLSRSTIDDPYVPTRGSITDLSFEFVEGDFNFQRFNGSYTVFIPLREDFYERTTVLSLESRVGYIPQDRGDVPVFERFYAGGQSFRGFEFRTISPRGVNSFGNPSPDPVGGTWSFFAGAEIRQPVFSDIFAVAAFIDSGTVTFDPGFEEYRVSVGVGIRLSIPQLSPAPLAFDFGFPIVKEDTDEERLFSFSIDLPF